MVKWQGYKLNELGKVNRGKSKHRPRNEPSLFGGKYPFIQTGEIKATDFYITNYSQTYSEKGLAQSKLWKKGTLCITIAANIAETAILGIDACFPDSIIGFVADENKSDVKFIKYHFDLLKLHLQSISQGTTQDNLSQEKLLKFTFTVPVDVKHQQHIASILSAYDDLIEVNNQRIKLLEETARELYKEWFVRMRFPGYKETKFVKGVPEGWEVKSVNDIADVTSSKRIFLSDYVSEGVPFYRGKEISIKSNNEEVSDILYITNIKFAEIKKRFGVPVVGDILITAVGTIGNIYLVNETDGDFYFKDGNLIWLRKFKSKELSFYFYYYSISDVFINSLNSITIGSSQEALTIASLKKITLFVPTQDLINKFYEMAYPIKTQINILQQQNTQLRQIRDRLLPRLISGKLEVKEK